MSNIINSDGQMAVRWHQCRHENKTYVTLEQDKTQRQLILERNAELRKNKDVKRNLSFGGWVASIPYEDYHMLRQKFPKLRSRDAKDRSEEMMRILQMPEYRYLTV